jgi:HEAT repeat protein
VRRTVLDLLARYAEAADILAAIAVATEGELRDRALTALANHGVFKPGLVPHYLTYLQKNATELKPSNDVVDAMASMAKILGQAQVDGALEGFTSLCRSTSRRLRRTGIEGILKYPAEQRGSALITLADTHDKSMLSTIALSLAESQDQRAVVPLIRTYVECTGRNVKTAFDYLQKDERLKDTDFLLKLLEHKSSSVRRYSAANLKTCKDPRVVDPLLTVSRDEDVEVQLASIEALGGFARTESRVAERLTEVCGQGDVTVRQAAVEALGNAQVESAVPVLIKALFNVFLRPRAEEALKKVGGRQGYLAMKRLKRREALFGSRYKRKKVKPKLKD